MEFTESKRGRRKLMFQGYVYVLDRELGEKTYWRCEKRQICRGRANSIDENVLETTPHNHPRDQADGEVQEIVNEVKKLASTTFTSAEKIVSDTIKDLDESVAAKLPSSRSLTRLVRRLRQARGLSRKRKRRRDPNATEYPLLNKGAPPPTKKIKSKIRRRVATMPIATNNGTDEKANKTRMPKTIKEDKYFKSYSSLATHSDMIADYQRTSIYRQAILKNYECFYGKTVADVGCGTGILSVFCVKAGAKKVYAIEASDVVEETRKVVAANGMEDRIIVLHGKAEEIEIPETVDIIVSEWMGYMLLFEAMLGSVLHVRDRWLKQNGKMFPERAQLFLAPITGSIEFTNRVEFWKTTKEDYDVDMSPLRDSALQQLCKTVSIVPVAQQDIHSHAASLFDIELTSVLPRELTNIEGSFRCPCFGHGNVLGFTVWFAVSFPGGLTLNTSPYEQETHWQQAVLHIEPITVEQDSIIEGTLTLKQNRQDYRCLDVDLKYSIDGQEMKNCIYKMNNEI